MKPEDIQALKEIFQPMIIEAVKANAPADTPKMGANATGGNVQVIMDELDKHKKEVADSLGIPAEKVSIKGEANYRSKALQNPNYRDACEKFLRFQITPPAQRTRKMEEDALGAVKAMSVGSDSAGGYLVPDGFRAEVMYVMGDYSDILKLVGYTPMDDAKLDCPIVTSGPTMYWPGENASITESQPVLDNLALSASLGAIYIPFSRQLAMSKKIDLVALLRDLAGEQFAAGIEDALVNGSGTNKPKGFTHSDYTDVTSVSLDGSALAYEDLVHLLFSPAAKYRKTGVWALNSTALRLVSGLKDSANRPVWMDCIEGQPGKILGKPYYEIESLSATYGSSGAYTTRIYFGAFKKAYLLGDQQQMAFESSTEAGSLFQNHQMAIKGTLYIDGKLGIQAAIRYLTGVK